MGSAKVNTAAPSARFSDKPLVFVVDSEYLMLNPNRHVSVPGFGRPRNDFIVFAMVIDETGRVEMPTVSVLNTPAYDLKDPFCRFLIDAQYRPYSEAGVPKRALILVMFGISTTMQVRSELGTHTSAPPINLNLYRNVIRAETPDSTVARLNSRPHCT
ncbi:MAG: hypothetical protein ABJC26_12585, partial [Gemmatimonadaceae bacterium]